MRYSKPSLTPQNHVVNMRGKHAFDVSIDLEVVERTHHRVLLQAGRDDVTAKLLPESSSSILGSVDRNPRSQHRVIIDARVSKSTCGLLEQDQPVNWLSLKVGIGDVSSLETNLLKRTNSVIYFVLQGRKWESRCEHV